jgi:amino acid transporter
VGPIPQAFRLGLGSAGAVAFFVPFAVFAVTSRMVANSSVVFTATTRMPMVAGWDRLMPAWFTQLHPKYRTPVNSILFIAACALVFAVAGMTSVGEQEAFQLLETASGVFYGLTYLALFAIPIIGLPAPLWLRALAVAGFATTTLYAVLSIFPIVNVVSPLAFALKIGVLIVGANALGAILYLIGRAPATPRVRASDLR